jgi:hypothetical protein
MVSTPAPPRPPDPEKTAQAQADLNSQTAITQYGLNATNQSTPYGNLTYNQIGTWEDGTPRYEAVTSLTPEQQAILDQNQQFALSSGQLANSQVQRLTDHLGQPIDLSNDAVTGYLNNLYSEYYQPLMDEQWKKKEVDLLNRGIGLGTEAYDREYRNFMDNAGRQQTNWLLNARQQGVGEMLQARNQPINEITALMSGSQVSNPTWAPTSSAGVAPVDYTGLVQSNYAGQLNNYNQQIGANNAMLSGLFGLGGAALGGWAKSDRRLKTDIKRVGRLDSGIGVYTYRLEDGPIQMGVMADEVVQVAPHAVRRDADGFDSVNYGGL